MYFPIFLIDDLNAELDQKACRILINTLNEMGCQTFLTGIERQFMSGWFNGKPASMFHVEHGEINPVAVKLEGEHEVA